MKCISSKAIVVSLALIILVIGCRTNYTATTYDYPQPVDTRDRDILYQEKKTYHIASTGVYASNEFDGARLSAFTQEGENLYKAEILPENEPINPSPWYAMELWSDTPQTIQLNRF